MANGEIAKSVAIGGTTGVVGGPIGIAAGAVAGYLSSSGIFGGKKKPKLPPPTPWYRKPIYYDIGGVLIAVAVLAYLVKHKR